MFPYYPIVSPILNIPVLPVDELNRLKFSNSPPSAFISITIDTQFPFVPPAATLVEGQSAVAGPFVSNAEASAVASTLFCLRVMPVGGVSRLVSTVDIPAKAQNQEEPITFELASVLDVYVTVLVVPEVAAKVPIGVPLSSCPLYTTQISLDELVHVPTVSEVDAHLFHPADTEQEVPSVVFVIVVKVVGEPVPMVGFVIEPSRNANTIIKSPIL